MGQGERDGWEEVERVKCCGGGGGGGRQIEGGERGEG